MTNPDIAAADDVLQALFTAEAGQPDPYPLYRRLRDVAPVHRSELDGVWYLSRYEDCQRVLRDPRCGRKPDGRRGDRVFFVDGDRAHQFTQRMRHNMLWANPPDHTRLRAAANPAFMPRRMEALRDRVADLVDGCLDGMVGVGPVDAMETLASRLPILMIGDLLGVPEGDRLRFQGMAEDPLTVDSAPGVESALATYLAELLAQRRRRPEQDILSMIAAGSAGFPPLDETEQVSTAVVLFWAGYSTTSNLVGNGLAALLSHPSEWGRLGDGPATVTTAVDELLRFDSPVQLNGRHVFEAIEVGGQHIPAGSSVIAVIGAANRDPERFADPDRLDIGRPDNVPLSFGLGVHYCLGAPLARLEAETVLRRLLERRLVVEAAGQPLRAPGIFIRGYQSLPVTVRAA